MAEALAIRHHRLVGETEEDSQTERALGKNRFVGCSKPNSGMRLELAVTVQESRQQIILQRDGSVGGGNRGTRNSVSLNPSLS
jgi:hypothetical protein